MLIAFSEVVFVETGMKLLIRLHTQVMFLRHLVLLIQVKYRTLVQKIGISANIYDLLITILNRFYDTYFRKIQNVTEFPK